MNQADKERTEGIEDRLTMIEAQFMRVWGACAAVKTDKFTRHELAKIFRMKSAEEWDAKEQAESEGGCESKVQPTDS